MVTKAIYIIIGLMILFSATIFQTVAYGVTDKKQPTVKITVPAPDSTLPAGTISVQGTASDNRGGSGLKIIQVRVDNNAYSTAIPKSPGDWSTWSISKNITTEGSHIIDAKATDNAGNQNLSFIIITIAAPPPEIDTTPPSITPPPNVVAEATGIFTTVLLGTPTVTDNKDPSPSVTNNSPSSFPLSVTTVTWTATDSSGNTASATQTVTITEPPNDVFGIKKIYSTKTDGDQWYMNMDNILNDTLFSTIPAASSNCSTPKTCTLLYKNSSENTWHASRIDVPLNEGIRIVVKSPPNTLWLNTEMTGYYKLRNSTYYPQEFIHVIRSGSPHSSTCEGYSYYAGITFDGNVAKVQKSLYHGGDGLGYSQTLYVRGVTTPLNDRWIGMKTMTYNINDNTAVKLEIWIDDLANNNWRKVFEQVDTGWTIPGNPATFGCINPLTGLPSSNNDIILWEGTEQQFRADNAEIDFHRLSIREIVPPIP